MLVIKLAIGQQCLISKFRRLVCVEMSRYSYNLLSCSHTKFDILSVGDSVPVYVDDF